MEAWTIVKAVNSGLRALGVGTGPIGAFVSGPVGMAIGATYSIKRWVDSENSKVYETVKKREGCPHIVMLEGSPPTPSALLFVANGGGVAWRTANSAIYFWHKEPTFRPIIFADALLQGRQGVKLVQNDSAFSDVAPRPPSGYGCSECRKISAARN